MNPIEVTRFSRGYFLDDSRNVPNCGGNKARKVKAFIDANPPNAGLMTVGSRYSTHVLACAYWARVYELPFLSFVPSDAPLAVECFPNLHMASILGAEFEWVPEADAYEYIESRKSELACWTWVPAGAHSCEGAVSYEKAFSKLFALYPILKDARSVVLPFGTGTTALGIAAAICASRASTMVIGVSVARDRDTCLRAVKGMGMDHAIDRISIDDRFAGEYGRITRRSAAARDRLFKCTGVLVDPIYNAKAAAVIFEDDMKDVLLLHTGGLLNNLL